MCVYSCSKFRKVLVEVYLNLGLSHSVIRVVVDKVRDEALVLEDVSKFSSDVSSHMCLQHIVIRCSGA